MKRHTHSWILIVLCLILFRASVAAPPLDDDDDEDEDEDSSAAAAEWFLGPRIYPSDDLPTDARRAAWAAAQQTGGTRAGVTDFTQPYWMNIGPKPSNSNVASWGHTSGRINTIAIKPDNPNVVLIGSATGGIWRSTDGGSNFVPVADDQVDLAVGSIAFSPSNPAIVYAGMGDRNSYVGYGILKSTDGGRSWTHVNNGTYPAYAAARKLVVDPMDPNRINVAVSSYLNNQTGLFLGGGFYMSTDGGVNWTRSFPCVARDMVADPVQPLTLYGAAIAFSDTQVPASGVYRSTDGGRTWAMIPGSVPFYASPYGLNTGEIRVAISAADPQKLWVYWGNRAAIPESQLAALNLADGSAETWHAGPDLIDTGQFAYNNYVAVDPANPSSVYIGSRDVWKATRNADGTLTLSNITLNRPVYSNGSWVGAVPAKGVAHVDQHAIAFSPADPNLVFFGNDGGLYKSPDAGATFQNLNDSLNLEQFYTVSVGATDQSLFFGGLQDNGIQRKLPGSSTWTWMRSGDGGAIVINPLDSNIVFAVDDYVDTTGAVYRYNNRGQTFAGQVASASTFGEPASGGRIAFIPAFTGNGVDATLYYGTWRVFISTDLGASWKATGTADLTRGGQDYLRIISVSSANPGVIYTASNQGRVMVSFDAGINWTDISAGLPNRTITGITIDRVNPSVAFLTVSGYNVAHIFNTVDSGAHWTDISNNLPNIPTNALLIDPINPNTLYAGTDIGVFRSDNGGSSWSLFNNGLPPVVVTSFASQPSGLIRIGTWGRGAYELVVPGQRSGPDFNLADRGGASLMSTGAANSVAVGYGRIQPNSISSSPSGIAIFGYRQNNVLISETGVPASAALSSGRIYAEVAGPVDTGLAIANPNNVASTLSFYFTDVSGNQSGSVGTITIPPNQQIAKFIDDPLLKVYDGATFAGSFSFTSTAPVGVVALRGFTNERGDFLMSTLPVIDTAASPRLGTVVVPHFADGGGWSTQIFLTNPTNNVLNGNINFLDPAGRTISVTIGGTSGSLFTYSIPARSAQKFVVGGTRTAVVSGSVRINPVGTTITAVPMVLFSYKPGSVTVSEAGVPVVSGTVFRAYVESSTAQAGNIQTGIAISPVVNSPITVTFDLTDLSGMPVTGVSPVSMQQTGLFQYAKFLGDIFPTLPKPFKGVLRIITTSTAPVSVVGLRARTNERGDLLMTTTPPTVENSAPVAGELLFPHFADGGGFTTQFILFSGQTGQTPAGNIRLMKPDGTLFSLPFISP